MKRLMNMLALLLIPLSLHAVSPDVPELESLMIFNEKQKLVKILDIPVGIQAKQVEEKSGGTYNPNETYSTGPSVNLIAENYVDGFFDAIIAYTMTYGWIGDTTFLKVYPLDERTMAQEDYEYYVSEIKGMDLLGLDEEKGNFDSVKRYRMDLIYYPGTIRVELESRPDCHVLYVSFNSYKCQLLNGLSHYDDLFEIPMMEADIPEKTFGYEKQLEEGNTVIYSVVPSLPDYKYKIYLAQYEDSILKGISCLTKPLDNFSDTLEMFNAVSKDLGQALGLDNYSAYAPEYGLPEDFDAMYAALEKKPYEVIFFMPKTENGKIAGNNNKLTFDYYTISLEPILGSIYVNLNLNLNQAKIESDLEKK